MECGRGLEVVINLSKKWLIMGQKAQSVTTIVLCIICGQFIFLLGRPVSELYSFSGSPPIVWFFCDIVMMMYYRRINMMMMMMINAESVTICLLSTSSCIVYTLSFLPTRYTSPSTPDIPHQCSVGLVCVSAVAVERPKDGTDMVRHI